MSVGESTERLVDVDDTRSEVAGLVRAMYRRGTAVAAEIGRATGMYATDVDALRVLDASATRPTMSELGATLGLSSAAVTSLVDRLESAGLARRAPDPDDRRRIRVEATDNARAVALEHLRPLVAAIDRALDSTDPADLATVARFLHRLLDDPESASGRNP